MRSNGCDALDPRFYGSKRAKDQFLTGRQDDTLEHGDDLVTRQAVGGDEHEGIQLLRAISIFRRNDARETQTGTTRNHQGDALVRQAAGPSEKQRKRGKQTRGRIDIALVIVLIILVVGLIDRPPLWLARDRSPLWLARDKLGAQRLPTSRSISFN